jgi:leader peptidase (prepilin peptidase) / N-methyltransferase
METLWALPFVVQALIALGFGLIIGSFLNVYIYRFHTGKSLQGKSHCLSCGTGLKVYELVPLLSYLCLRGRCRTCCSVIPSRYFLVELLTGVLFVGVLLIATDLFTLLLMWATVAVLVVIAVYDLYHLIIPDELVATLLAAALVFKGYELVLTADASSFMYDLLAALAGALFFFVLWYASKGRWIGFGDVKLAVPLGLIVGYAGVFSMIVLSFWIGAILGLLILSFQSVRARIASRAHGQTRRLTMKSAVPFAPFLILGFLAVWVWGIDVVALLSYA